MPPAFPGSVRFLSFFLLDNPSLVISIIGKVDSFPLEGKATEIFSRDLMAVCGIFLR